MGGAPFRSLASRVNCQAELLLAVVNTLLRTDILQVTERGISLISGLETRYGMIFRAKAELR
jgi:hypothetical protein